MATRSEVKKGPIIGLSWRHDGYACTHEHPHQANVALPCHSRAPPGTANNGQVTSLLYGTLVWFQPCSKSQIRCDPKHVTSLFDFLNHMEKNGDLGWNHDGGRAAKVLGCRYRSDRNYCLPNPCAWFLIEFKLPLDSIVAFQSKIACEGDDWGQNCSRSKVLVSPPSPRFWPIFNTFSCNVYLKTNKGRVIYVLGGSYLVSSSAAKLILC